MNKLSDYLIPIIIGILIGCPFWIYAGATITDAHAEQYRIASVNNAVSEAIERIQTPLNCKSNDILAFIESMARNGIPVTDYSLMVKTHGTDGSGE